MMAWSHPGGLLRVCWQILHTTSHSLAYVKLTKSGRVFDKYEFQSADVFVSEVGSNRHRCDMQRLNLSNGRLFYCKTHLYESEVGESEIGSRTEPRGNELKCSCS